ncbi:hypothetical protein SCHIN_v1c07600 [Spiroplasma chinense]|uniref:Uncharacterized protein n=1 Tax=Spiroplasma chinense TaxID=216932 RepID=A0A5B9Y563_9MOLU|nr:hypothetical protein [Spiroplasma chinense]QEH61955.1 hypothetical protein SCHIN_v1c07600 [Spiroplasma chinense]
MKELISIKSAKELDSFKNCKYLLLFKRYFAIPGTGDTYPFIPRVAPYLKKVIPIDEKEFYNPITKRLANAILLDLEESYKILESKSFNYHLENYGISFTFFAIVNEEDLLEFDANIVYEKKEEKKLALEEKWKQAQRVLNGNKNDLDSLNELCYHFALKLLNTNILVDKPKITSYKKLFSISKIALIRSILYAFAANKKTIKILNLDFLKKDNLKVWFDNLSDYLEDKFIDNTDFLSINDCSEILENKKFKLLYFNLDEILLDEEFINLTKELYKTFSSKTKTLQRYVERNYGYEDGEFILPKEEYKLPSKSNFTSKSNYLNARFSDFAKGLGYELKKYLDENF